MSLLYKWMVQFFCPLYFRRFNEIVTTNTTASRYSPFWPVTYCRRPHSLKTRLLGRGFHTLIRNVLFPSPTNMGSLNPPLLGAQHLRWHTARYLALIPFVTAKTTASRYCPLWPITYRHQPHGFKTHLLERSFRTMFCFPLEPI